MQVSDQTRNLRSKANLFFVGLAFICLPLMAHAGGLGIAAVAAIAGFAALITLPLPKLRDIGTWGLALTAFLAWAFISALWSPYEDPHTLSNPVKLFVGVGLFYAFDRGVKAASLRSARVLRTLVIGMLFAGLGLLLIDLLFPYAVTYWVDPIGADEHPINKAGDILGNLGHAVAVYTLLVGFIVGLMSGRGRIGAMLSIIFVIGLLVAAISHGLAVGILGVLAAGAAMGLAKFWPRLTLIALTTLGVLSILAAPLMGFAARAIGPDMKAKLPISWEHRVEMWNYILTKIAERPVMGHGFDAVRTFNEMYISRGLEFPYVSLHPHSAGLHIWVETGLIGAILASITLTLIGVGGVKTARARPELAGPLAGFAAAAIVICTVTFGVWQDWWWASLVMVVSLRHFIPGKPKHLSM